MHKQIVITSIAILAATLCGPGCSKSSSQKQVISADSTPKLALAISCLTNDVAGLPAVAFLITNQSSSSVTFAFETQVRKDGPLKWYPADIRHPDMVPRVVAARSSLTLVIRPPMKGVTWRGLIFYANRVAINGKKRSVAVSPEITP